MIRNFNFTTLININTVQAKNLNTPLFSRVFKMPKFLQC